MSWEDVENAMQSAVVKASGLDADKVVWSYQNVNEPELDHIVITFGGAITLGIDRLQVTQDLTRPNGQEIKHEVKGLREVPFELEVFTEATSGDGAARHLLELIRTRFRLSSIREPLTKVGLSPFDPGPVSYVPYIPSAEFRGRATCTIRCYVPVQDCFEYTGYIARVRGTFYPVGWIGHSGASGVDFDSDNGG